MPTAESPFVGREFESGRISARVRGLGHGEGCAVVIEGAAGVGKTTLVRHVLESCDWPVIHGAAYPDGQTQRLEPLRGLLRTLHIDASSELSTDGPETLHASVMRALDERTHRHGPFVLVVDDLHWADATSLSLLGFLIHRLSEIPVMVVLGVRTGESLPQHVTRLIAASTRLPHVERLELPPLSPEEAALLARLHGPDELADCQVARIVDRSDGVPLFVAELAAAAHPEAPVSALPSSLASLFRDQVAALPPAAVQLLSLVSLAGRPVTHGELDSLAIRTGVRADVAIDHLLDSGMLTSGDDEYVVRHQLLSEAVVLDLRPFERRALHQHWVSVLSDMPHDPAEVARHCERAGDWDAAYRATVRAAAAAARDRAYLDAMHLEQSALDLLDRLTMPPDDPASRRRLHLSRAAEAAASCGEDGIAAGLLEKLLPELGNASERAYVRGRLVSAQFLDAEPAAALRTSISGLDDEPPASDLRARAFHYASSAFARELPAVPGSAEQATTQAVALARSSRDPASLSFALASHAFMLASRGRIAESEQTFAEADQWGVGLDDARMALRPSTFRVQALALRGDLPAVADAARATIARAESLGVGRSSGQVLRTMSIDALIEMGRWTEAEAVLATGLSWGTVGHAGLNLLLAHGELALHRGDTTEAARIVALAREEAPQGHPRIALLEARLAWWEGDLRHSRQVARIGLEQAWTIRQLHQAGPLLHVLCRSVADLGDHEDAAALRDRVAALGQSPVVRAWIAAADAEFSRTEESWNSAVAASLEANMIVLAGEICWRAGMIGDSPHEPRGWFRRSVAVLSGVDASAVRAAAEDALAQLEDAARTLDHGLTHREFEVLRLVAEGWTNKRIGQELRISPRTVGIHVSHVLTKLGAATRGEAVAMARRLGGRG